MVKKKVTTQSRKRYQYSSFKDRIENLKVNKPLIRSSRRELEVEVSNFYERYEHWKEINITQNFTEFISNNEQLFQTLPQMLYHQKKIYEELILYLTKEDNIELTFEPLLDLLSQFVHDLGEDFYEPYFERTVNVLTEIAAKNFDNSNILEWTFNCLGFIFKYLSPILSKDLIDTFKLLIPLYQYRKSKSHLARFASELLSFLIKKIQLQNMLPFVELTMGYVKEDDELSEPLVIMYSEAMTNVNGTLHSKCQHLLSVLLDYAPQSPNANALVCEIILNLLSHATVEASSVVYVTVLEKISNLSTSEKATKSNTQLLIALSFAQSGKKVTSWKSLLDVVVDCFQDNKETDIEVNNSIVQLSSIILRNCDMQELTKFHVKLFQYMARLNNGLHYLPFIEASLELSTERVFSFGSKYIQDFINSSWEQFPEQIALFLSNLTTKSLDSKFAFVIPHGLQQSIEKYLRVVSKKVDSKSLREIHWRLLILRHVSSVEIADHLLKILNSLFLSTDSYSLFQQDVAGLILQSLSRQTVVGSSLVMTKIFDNFERYKLSADFLKGILQLIQSSTDSETLAKFIDPLMKCVISNISSSSHEVRYISLSIIMAALSVTKQEVPSLISQCHLIEDIPLTLQTARDIQLRTRSLGSEFANTAVDSLSAEVVPRFLFGLLTVKFKPSWDAAYDAIVTISRKADQDIWNLAYGLIIMDYSSEHIQEQYESGEESQPSFDTIDNHEWLVKDHRLNDNTTNVYNKIDAYTHFEFSIVEHARDKKSDTSFRSIMRSQALTALGKVPEIAEAHASLLVPLLLNEDLEAEEASDESEKRENSSTWNLTERNLLVSLFEKFKSLKNVPKSDQVYEHMLMLLANKQNLILKSALSCIFNFKNPHIGKYRDNLKSLLDDTLFRDELFKLIATDGDVVIIEEQDKDDVLKLVLRVLFGRFQTSKSSGMNKGKKFAVISVLPSLEARYVTEFLKLGSDRIPYLGFLETGKVDPAVLSTKLFRRELGLVNLLTEVIGILGSGFNESIATMIEPLVFSLSTAQYAIDHKDELPDPSMEAAARKIRVSGMRCLNDLFHIIKDGSFWSTYLDPIYQSLIEPRLSKFAEENLQQQSSLLKLLVCWSSFQDYQKFLFVDDFYPLKALLSLLSNENAKDSVLSIVFDLCLAFSGTTSLDDDFINAVSVVVEVCLVNLSSILDRIEDKDVNSKAVSLLLSLSEHGYIEDYETKKSLINSLVNAFDKPNAQVDSRDKVNILKALASIVENFECSRDEIVPLYEACSKSFRTSSDKKIRQSMCDVFVNIGERFPEFEPVGRYLSALNSFATSRMNEPDFERRLSTFKEINESEYMNLDSLSWLPLVYCGLYFMNDKEELSIRTNATYMLCRFVDCFSSKDTKEEASSYIHLLKNIILPLLRLGLRSEEEVVQTEYISLLSHIVSSSKNYHDLDDMKVLLFDGDEEANFFSNINHIQLHRRQRAIRRLRTLQTGLSDGSISHYIIPMIENYAFAEDEKLLNISNDTIETIGVLSCSMSWNQFKALLKRYLSYLTSKKKSLRSSVNLVVSVSNSFSASVRDEEKPFEKATELAIDQFLTKEILPPLTKILSTRDDETIVLRLPLSEALTSLIICLAPEKVSIELPGMLTSVCQVMRSRSEELRDAVRKNLGKMAKMLGVTYLKFLLQELKSALTRGSQIHVLSFSIHHLLVVMADELSHGDLDESAQLLIDIIMEDIFGAAGQEKDAEGYTSKMKEVKHNKSFDTAEILAAKVTLNNFSTLITPVKLLLSERIALKTQNKLDELLRRYALGLNHNEDSSKRDILVLCFQLYQQSSDIFKVTDKDALKKKSQAADHFLVKLNAKAQKTQNEYSLYSHTLQKFSLEILRVTITRNESLATTENLEGFVPLLEEGLRSDNEGVIISSIKVLNIIIRLPFSEEIENSFKTCARTVLNIIKDSPSTNSELSQASLRFLATLIRHKPDIKLKDTALSYILTKIQPDLQEPNRQGLAFNFLNALVSSHVMIAEIYDTMDKVREIMITNHSKEIRDISRNVYYKFLMEYDQSRGRLEKQFKFLVDNLQYPTENGRQSVMGLLHFIINKSGAELLSHLASSFYVSLAMVMTSDDSGKCREMSGLLISSLLKKLALPGVEDIEKYIHSWISQDKNPLLLRCGLQSYKLFVNELGLGRSETLNQDALLQILKIFDLAKKLDEGDDVEWELIYAALTVFASIASDLGEKVYQLKFTKYWQSIIDSLLYPHPWVRLASCRLIGNYLTQIEKLNLSKYTVQTIAYRLLRQLAAPGISEPLGSQIVKNLTKITLHWKLQQTPYVDADDVLITKDHELAVHWAISRTSAIMRNEVGDKLVMGKRCAIQYTALLIQILSPEEMLEVAETVILPLYNFSQSNNAQDEELVNLALETLNMLETALGVSDYTKLYSNVQQRVYERRRERKAKRSQLAITAPDLSAKRKMRKHERFREKRKHEKDENGYYKAKRKKIDRMKN